MHELYIFKIKIHDNNVSSSTVVYKYSRQPQLDFIVILMFNKCSDRRVTITLVGCLDIVIIRCYAHPVVEQAMLSKAWQ